MLYRSQELDETDRALQSRVNQCIARSDMAYDVAQGINYFVGTHPDGLRGAKEELQTAIEADLSNPKAFEYRMKRINQLHENLQLGALKDLARELFGLGLYGQVGIVFDAVIEREYGGWLYPLLMDLFPDILNPGKAVDLIANFDAVGPVIAKVGKVDDRESLTAVLLSILPLVSPHPDQNEAIDANISKMLDSIKEESKLIEALSYVLVYYSRNRNNTDKAELLLNHYFQQEEPKKETIKMAAQYWNSFALRRYQNYPYKEGWRTFVFRFLSDPHLRSDVKKKALDYGGISLDEEVLLKINPEWNAINE
jgi:hypothetical protein